MCIINRTLVEDSVCLWMSVWTSVYVNICLCVCRSVQMSGCVNVHVNVCLCVCRSVQCLAAVWMSMCISVCVYAGLYKCEYLSVMCVNACLCGWHVCLSVYLSVCLLECPFECLSEWVLSPTCTDRHSNRLTSTHADRHSHYSLLRVMNMQQQH